MQIVKLNGIIRRFNNQGYLLEEDGGYVSGVRLIGQKVYFMFNKKLISYPYSMLEVEFFDRELELFLIWIYE